MSTLNDTVQRCSTAVEVYMEGHTWEPATVYAVSVDGRDALIEHKGVTTWLYRERGPGHPNEWRWKV